MNEIKDIIGEPDTRHEFTVDYSYHFTCSHCGKSWSYMNWHLKHDTRATCPHCSWHDGTKPAGVKIGGQPKCC